jgi:hypothetical protein
LRSQIRYLFLQAIPLGIPSIGIDAARPGFATGRSICYHLDPSNAEGVESVVGPAACRLAESLGAL